MVVAVVSALVAFVLPVAGGGAGEPRITRLFIPAIKADCRQRRRPGGCRARLHVHPTARCRPSITTALTGIEPDGSGAQRVPGAVPDPADHELPHDHYSRNLLYDYYVTDLQPCLADRVSDLPPMPTRADFVSAVRLGPVPHSRADPALAQLLEYETDCPELPAWALE